MLKTEHRDIDGTKFTTTQMPATKGFPLMAQVLGVLGPVLAQAGNMKGTDDASGLLPALAGVFARLKRGEAEQLQRDILQCTAAEIAGRVVALDNEDAINMVFSGRLKTMLLAMKFALEVHFQDFFGGGQKPADDGPPRAAG